MAAPKSRRVYAHKRTRNVFEMEQNSSVETHTTPLKRVYLEPLQPHPAKRLSSSYDHESFEFKSLKKAPTTLTSQAILLDQARLNERRRYDEQIRRMEEQRQRLEMENQVYLRELHYLQMAQARGYDPVSPYVYSH